MWKKTNSNVEDIALQWLRYSNRDLTDAMYLINKQPSSPALACWLCQQAAEKTKAARVLEKIHFPRTHDLNALLDILPETWIVKNKHATMSELTAWNINARYPGDWPEPTHEDAVGARSIAHSVYDLVAAEFKNRGILI